MCLHNLGYQKMYLFISCLFIGKKIKARHDPKSVNLMNELREIIRTRKQVLGMWCT